MAYLINLSAIKAKWLDPLPIRSHKSSLTDPEMSPLVDPQMSPIMDPVMSPLMDPQMSPSLALYEI